MPTINRTTIRVKPPRKKSNKQGTKYYSSRGWYTLRNWYIKEHPLCEQCEKEGRTTIATQVHHIIPFLNGQDEDERYALLLSEDNLMSLCNDCHHKKHRHK